MGGTLMGGRGSAGRTSKPQQPAQNPPREVIRDVYADLLAGREPGERVSLTRLRAALPADLSRAEADAALLELARDPDVNMVPESNQKMLTDDDQAAALRLGAQDKHLINITPPVDPGARERIVSGGLTAASEADLAMAQRDPATRSALYDDIRAEVHRREAPTSTNTGAAAGAGAEGRIREAFAAVAGEGDGRWVSLVEIRAQLADLPRAEVDAALRSLNRRGDVVVDQMPFKHRVGLQEKDAAIHIGGEDLHQIRIYPPDYQ